MNSRPETTNKSSSVETLKARRDFLRVRSGKRYSSSFFTLQGKKRDNPQGDPRIGYTVTTKIGNSVIRNRIKRRLREVAKISFPSKAHTGNDYVLIAKREVLNADFSTIVKELDRALDHLGAIGSKRLGQKEIDKSGKQAE